MKELNKFRQFLAEGKKKTIKEASFGNDPESRYEYIRPLMSKLPDSARTEALIDGMEEALAEDDKMEFDFYFVEAMKMLGLEKELMEPDDMMSEPDYEDYAPDSALGPNPSFVEEAEGEKTDYTKRKIKASDYYAFLDNVWASKNPRTGRIDDKDLEAASDYFDSLPENDKVLDELIKEGTWSLGGPKEIDSVIKGLQGIIKMADDAQTKRNAAGRGFVNALQNQLKDEGWNQRLYKILGDDSFFDHYDVAKAAAEVRDFDNVKNHLGDAIARAEELKAAIMKNSGIKEGKVINERRAIPIASRKISLSGMGLKPLQQVLNDKEMDKFENVGIVYDVMGKGSQNKSGRLVKVEYGEEDERGRPKLQTKMANGEDTKGVVGLLMIPKGKLGDVVNTLKTEYDTQIKVLQSKLDALNNVFEESLNEGLTQDILKKHPKKYKDEKAVKAAAAKLMKNPKFKGKGIGPVLQALLKGKE